jgi:L-ascorbate metabolism protein UlaG (beta-lactamase superfamily)
MDYRSDHFDGRIFLNPVPTDVMRKGAMPGVLFKWFEKHPGVEPEHPLGPFQAEEVLHTEAPPNAVRITWLGHSGVIIDLEGKRLLADPLWYARASPFKHVGPKRFFENPVPMASLPKIDYLLLSHDHYDHLDKDAILALTAKGIPVITMLGVGQRLIKWGVNPSLVTETDWWQTTTLEGLEIITAPARHFSGRWLADRNKTLWGSFVLKGKNHRVYFGADSGYYDGFKKIGDAYGPFDLTMLEIGAYNEDWPSIHMGPENAVQAHLDLRGRLLMPLHWGTFGLAFHPWKEPIQRLIKAAADNRVDLLAPAPGDTVVADAGPYNSFWWDKFS